MVAFGLALAVPPANAAGTTFSSTWDTTKTSTGSSGSNQIKLPLIASGNYNFVVDWGDGSSNTITAWNQADATHTYASSGVKSLSIAGTIRGWQFANSGDRLKITDISAWGPLQLGNDGAYFWGAANLNLTATDGPDLSATSNLSNTFLNATTINADLSGWDVSAVTNLTGTFRGATAFNGDVSNWNVGAVTTMNGTFRSASAFNNDISGWDVSSVTNMTSMFNGATAFDRDLGGWDISDVLDMPSMFSAAGVSRTNYDSLLIGWAAQSVKPNVEFNAGSAKYTAGPASAAHDELTGTDGWEITDGGVTSAPDAPTTVNTTRADTGATATWNASVSNNEPVVEYVATINPAPSSGSATCSVVPPASRSCTWANLTNGETYSITVTARNAVGTSAPSTPVTVIPEVDTPNAPVVTVLSAVALDQEARVTWGAPSGGGTPISYTATSTPGGQTCTATAPTLTCNVEGLTNGTEYQFRVTATNPGGTSVPSAASNGVTPGPTFESTWNTTLVQTGGSGSQQIRLPLVADGEYDFIVDWGDGTFSNIITEDVDPGNLSGITHSYETGGVKQLTITGTIKGWNFQQSVAGNKESLKLQHIGAWGSLQLGTATTQGEYFKDVTNLSVSATDALDMTGTTSLASAFEGATSFNGAIGNWDVYQVTDMSSMFSGATSFNQPLASWEPNAVTDMSNMFAGATAFNQPLSGWGSLSNVATMESMFANATAFNSVIGWADLDDLATTAGMFTNADAFNQPLGWVGAQPSLTNTAGMFSSADNFNADVSTIDMSSVTDATNMFANTADFNQPVGTWTLGTAVDVSDMFKNATSFNQDLSGWDFSGVTRFGQFLNNSGLANQNEASGVYNYNLLLQSIASQNVLPDNGPGSTTADRTIDSAPAKYSTGLPTTARETLVGRGFVITDGGQTNKDVPDAPTNIGGNTSQNPPTITWDAPDDNNSPIISYTVSASLSGELVAQCETDQLECTFADSFESDPGTYTYAVTATNAIGTSEPSASTAPEKPATPVAVAGDGKATVTITPPTTGATPATYTVTSNPGAATCLIIVPATSCDVNGLTNETSYEFNAIATNWVGDSPASDASNAVVPGKVLAMTWRTNNTSAASTGVNTIKLPLVNGGSYDFQVAWGDGTVDRITTWNQLEATHTYALPGTKNVSITGTINGWRFNNTGDRLKILGISTWGPLQFGNAGSYFYGASNLVVTATDALNLTGTTTFFNAFLEASAFNGDVTDWDVDSVTDMTNAFKGTTAFQGTGLSTWNIANVAQMDAMFENSGMNADVTGWNTSASQDMNRMFAGATSFNQSIGAWNTGAVEDMTAMFSGATIFNKDISGWNTGAVQAMAGMFEGSGIDATRDFSNWNIANVTNFTNMFRNNAGLAMPGSISWYNGLLTGWAPQINTDGAVTLTVCGAADSTGGACGDGAPQYTAGAPENARLDLIDQGWTVIDGGLSDLNVPDQIGAPINAVSDGPNTIVTWTEPADNGSAITSYAVQAVDKNDHNVVVQCATVSAPIVTANCAYSTADFLFSVTATNAIGMSIPSSIDVPGINPPIVTLAGSGALRLTVDPAAGGTPEYFAFAASSGGVYVCQFAAPQQSCVVTGLTNGVEYQFIAAASNWVGASEVSGPSVAIAPTADVFTSSWDTTATSAGSSNSTSVSLPLVGDGTYDFTVNWGDGTSSDVDSAIDPDATHVYTDRGIQNIAITGEINGWSFNGSGDRLKLTDVSSWGPLRLGNSGGYFKGAANFNVSATAPPNLTGTTDLSEMFSGATAFNADVSGWDVSGVTDMSAMFSGSGFTGDVAGWDVSSVTSMGGMFSDTGFNGDVSQWQTTSLVDVNNMFKSSAFTGDISGWDITGVTNASGLLQDIATMTGPSFINWYNNVLISWAAQDVPERSADSVPFTACGAVDDAQTCTGGLQYYGSAATAARNSLITKGWQIFDGGVADANIPDAPTGISVVRAGTEATVTWTAPADNGSPITGYQVTTDPDSITCDSATTECVVTGLNADENVKYSYTVTATNAVGTSAASAPYPVLRPGVPGAPSAVAGDASAVVTVPASTTGGEAVTYTVTASGGGATCTITLPSDPLSCQVNGLENGTAYTFTAVADNDGGTSEPSAASAPVTPLAPAKNVEFGDPTPTAEGFTVQILNFDDSFTWSGSATASGSVSISGSGLVTVTGVAPATETTATVNAVQFGFEDGSGQVSATSLLAGLTPAFALPVTATAGGFTVQISNYSALYGWVGVSTASGSVAISESGLVSVTNVAPDTLAEVTITTSRDGYADADAQVDGTSLKAALTPEFGEPTPTPDGFTVSITNFNSADAFTWVAGEQTPDSATVDLNQGSGLVTVTNVAANTATSVTVTTTQAGFATGSATSTSKSLNAARTPEFGTVAPTPDGFTVPIDNYGTAGDGFTWTVSGIDPGTAEAAIASDTGVLTVTQLDSSTQATVTVTTTQTDYTDGEADISGTALAAAGTPVLGSVTRTEDGFTVPITNYYTDNNNTNYAWSVDELTSPANAEIVTENPAFVRVTGLTAGASVEITVRTEREGFANGQASTTGSALAAARTPAFATPTQTADGYTVQITNYGTAGDGFTWTVDDVDPSTAAASIDGPTGLVTVTQVDPGGSARVTIKTVQTGYVDGSDDVTGSAKFAALNPTFSGLESTADGYTVLIDNFSGEFDWAASATNTTDTPSIDLNTGVVTVTGVAPGSESTVTVTNTREGYVDGTGSTSGESIIGPVRTPTFGDVVRTAVGFTVPITNYGTNGDGYTWTPSVDPNTGAVAIDSSTGVLTVSGFAEGTDITATVDTTRTGYTSGTAEVEGRSQDPQVDPVLGTPEPTADGFTVQIDNYVVDGEGVTWGATATATVEPVTISDTGLVTVSGVAPGTESTVTVTADKLNHVQGSATATADSLTADAYVPEFATPTRTQGGFTVQITNYDLAYGWDVSTSAGNVSLDSGTGLVTVTGLADGASANVVVSTDREGYFDGDADVDGTALGAALTPTFGTPSANDDGFSVQITNFAGFRDPGTNEVPIEWVASANGTSDTPSISESGLVTVTGVAFGTESTLTVTTASDGYVGGTAQISVFSNNGPKVDPVFGDVTRTNGGFTVPITNYTDAGNSDYTWTPSATNGGAATISPLGLVTVTGIADDAISTLTVDVTRTGYDSGTASIGGQALASALTPAFGTKVSTPDGFTVQITNYDNTYGWSATATETEEAVTIGGTGLVTVTGVDPATGSTVTVNTTKDGHINGSAQSTATSLAEAVDPVFGTPSRVDGGYTVAITNFAQDDAFTWAIASASAGSADLDQTTGIVTVSGLAAGTPATVTVTTTRAGYVDGSADVTASSLNAALTPVFGTPTRTADGYTVQITNYNAAFTWNGTATATTNAVVISGSGLVTVSGVAPATVADTTVTTTRTGYIGGTATLENTAALNAALVPTFGTAVSTADGFQVTVTNYDPAFTWEVEATNTDFPVAVDDSGQIQVTGISPGQTSVATVTTAKTGYATGTATVEGTAVAGAALMPLLGTVISTAVGFDVQIENYRSGFTWIATGATATISSTGYVRVTGVSPGAAATVTIAASRSGYATGTATAVGVADRAATSAPPAIAPRQATITGIKVKQKKNNKSSAKISFTPGADGGAPLLGSKAACKQKGSKVVVKASGSSLSALTVKKLKNKKKYVCTVAVYNALGASVPSASKSFKVKG